MVQEPFAPKKYYSIDRVFRNEAVDKTHLAEFHQIEGMYPVLTIKYMFNSFSSRVLLLFTYSLCDQVFHILCFVWSPV